MDSLQVLHSDEREVWDSIVRSFKDYDIYYLSGYVKALEVNGDGEPLLFYYNDDSMRAINVSIKRNIAECKSFIGRLDTNKYYDLCTPYGYGGFIIEGQVSQQKINKLNFLYESFCKENLIISEFVRIHPILNNLQVASSMYETYDLGRTVTINLNSKEQIWKDLTSKNRNHIKKAINSNVKVYCGRSKELIELFYKLYNRTMDKNNADSYYYFKENFYESILNDLKYNALIFYAVHEDDIVAMSIILFSNTQMHYHLSASDIAFKALAPTNLLLYEAACWGCENGFKTFHLGGGLGFKEDSLFKFKESFNPKSNTMFSIGKKIFNHEIYNTLVSLRENDSDFNSDSLYFPLYRA